MKHYVECSVENVGHLSLAGARHKILETMGLSITELFDGLWDKKPVLYRIRIEAVTREELIGIRVGPNDHLGARRKAE